MELESTISFLLAKVTVTHRNLVQKAVKEVGLHSGQVSVLHELWKTDGQRQIDLAANLGLSPPTVNKILGGLLGNDFVTRAKYEDDARSTRIFLTQKGLDIRGPLEAQWAKLEEQTLSGLTDTEALMLRQLLVKLAVELG
ncbi:MAG: MarR family winged helix-turn-helix transcriptional regulator [Pyrinomonadaceae bacterium]